MLVQALEDEDFEALVDPKLEKNYIASEMFRMIEAAAACVRHSAAKRPRMSQVAISVDISGLFIYLFFLVVDMSSCMNVLFLILVFASITGG